MSSKSLMLFSLLLGLLLDPILIAADYITPMGFSIDVHSHIIPDIYRQALIAAGYPVINGTVYTDGFPVPPWNLSSYIAALNTQNISYATMSISAPGVSFLANTPIQAALLTRSINNLMHTYMQEYPTKLGALCLLPLPDIRAALVEIEYCLDTLKLDGVGLYSNFNGTYMGDPVLDPVFQLLNSRNATVFVHPAAPGCKGASIGYPDPITEYPFESVRAMENMLLTGQRSNYTNINIIFPHGGGAMPYLATRIAEAASIVGGVNPANAIAQFAGYMFDTAIATTKIQLNAMTTFFGGVDNIVTGTDYPYAPLALTVQGLATTQSDGSFTDTQMKRIRAQNALKIFPSIAKKLGFPAV